MRALPYVHIRTVADLLAELEGAHDQTPIKFWLGDRQADVTSVDVRMGAVEIDLAAQDSDSE